MQRTEPDIDNYKARRERLKATGLFDPFQRVTIERELAHDAGVEAADIALYASVKAPGAKSVTQRVEEARGDVIERDHVYARHKDIFVQHVQLWTMYLFVKQSLPSEIKARLSSLVRAKFDLTDESSKDRKQLALNL